MSRIKTIYPKRINRLLTNPGIGFIAAPSLMDGTKEIRDTTGAVVAPYQFQPGDRTFNHPDSKVIFCGVRWKDIEVQRGVFDWTVLDEKLSFAQSLGCTAVVRCSPYALSDEEDIPAWFRHEYKEEPEFPFWRVDPIETPYVTYWCEFIRAFGNRYDGHSIISSVDMALVGAWGEGGGTEFLPDSAIRSIVDAYIDTFKVTPLQSLLHDPKSLAIINERKENIGFRVDCLGDMGGFHGEEWSHMLDFYPQNIQNFHMKDAWKKAPVVFEACWHMNDWFLQGWDIDYIIEESLKWHISSYNSKGSIVPEPWKESVTRWLLKMGYRFELRKFTFEEEVRKGSYLHLSGVWANVGVAPIYQRYPLVFRLRNEEKVYSFTSKEDITEWLPDQDIYFEEGILLSMDMLPGTYQLELGIETGIKEIGNINLAIEGEHQGYYAMGQVIVR